MEIYHRAHEGMQYFEQCNYMFITLYFYMKFATYNIFQTFHRLPDTSMAIKARQEKHGQHKLGPGGYSNLVAQIVSISNSNIVSK